MARKKIVQSIFDYIDNGNLVDFMDLSQVPDVPQVPLERYEPARGMPANLNEILTPENAKRLEETAKRGMDQGGMEWYNLEPLRYAFVEQLGEKQGNEAFGRYIDYTAATSPRSTVASNIRRGSHFYNLDRNGQQVGGLANSDMPKGYGHIAHTTHDHKLREIEENGGLLPIKGPKVSSFAENLKGNQTPMTIDTHNFSAVRNDPKNKVSPTNTQYKYLEEFESEIADKMGITPAQMQASVWIAGDTGVADARPFMAVFDDVVTNTAERNGVSKSQALRDFIGGKAPLYGLAGITATGAMTNPEEAEAAGASAEEPALGWREWPTQDQPVPTSPAERGFPATPTYDELFPPSYMDRVTDPATYANALRPYVKGASWLANTPVGKFVGGNLSDAMDDAEIPARIAHGAGRGLFGLANGESISEAARAGVDTYGNTVDENATALENTLLEAGVSPGWATAAYWGTLLADPMNLLGGNTARKIAKGATR